MIDVNLKFIIGKNIKYYREGMNLNQTELGIIALGYCEEEGKAAQRQISRFETGSRQPNYPELLALKRVFKIKDVNMFLDKKTANTIPSPRPRPSSIPIPKTT